MTRIDNYFYTVVRGEIITFTIIPIGVAPLIVSTNNGSSLQNSGAPNMPIYQFQVDEIPGNYQFIVFDFKFLQDTDDDAKYEIELKDNGTVVVNLNPVEKTDVNWRRSFNFQVE